MTGRPLAARCSVILVQCFALAPPPPHLRGLLAPRRGFLAAPQGLCLPPPHGWKRSVHVGGGGRVRCGEGFAGEGEQRAEDLHVPVLLDEVLGVFEGRELGTFIDGTLGLAGHSTAMWAAHGEMKKLVGIDQDPIALEHARRRLEESGCGVASLVRGNFGNIAELAHSVGVGEGGADGILMDIGVSSMQLDDTARGFSFMREGPLDMRMDPSGTLTAADIVNNWSEEEIARVIFEFGEEPKSRSIAKKIVAARASKPLTTTLELSNLLGGDKPRYYNKNRKAALHPATLTFQGLRIAVNRELSVLSTAIPQAIDLLAPGGRLAIISFHSLEDRIVKWAFREAEGGGGASTRTSTLRKTTRTSRRGL